MASKIITEDIYTLTLTLIKLSQYRGSNLNVGFAQALSTKTLTVPGTQAQESLVTEDIPFIST